MADDGPWLDPHQNKKKNKNVKNGIHGKGNITKFFITNLPEGCTPWELSEFVKVFGEVAGAYVAKKKDKVGNRFGFISFSNVRDVKELERALNGTKMGNSKLKANIARFAVENANLMEKPVEIKKVKKPEHLGVPQGNLQGRNQAFIKEGGGRLFSDLFQMGNQSKMGSSSM
ncbi:putative RNA recognition motif domain, nucleotide-binding alpha-beta plait domain superfamily [Helianthus annuus]|nr:putative RNA recognition motif domain, nucleotide-binding alpha-beta plait domain superfamily [Helianthus annuus]